MQPVLRYGLVGAIAAVAGVAAWSQHAAASRASTRPAAGAAAEIAAAARALLDRLPAEQRALACRPLADPEREAWAFVPGRYAGIELGALDGPATEAAHGLLRTMLSARGYEKTVAIVRLEDVLRQLESAGGRDASHRDPARYALLVLGEPAADGTFAVRFQGHHVSLRVVCSNGGIVAHTPAFLGSNPHETKGADGVRRRVLGAEEDLARAFLLLLDDAQLARAVIGAEAPADVLLGPGKPPETLGARRGVAWKDLTEVQRGVLWRLLEEFAHVQRADRAAAELARIRAHGLDELSFAWAGGRERGQGHYWRLHGVDFAIEYDNTQDGANHVHTVWRDFANDFGGDVLRAHLEQQHGRR